MAYITLEKRSTKVNLFFITHLKCYNIQITKICQFKYTENFTTKQGKISDKNSDIFHIPAKKVDCGYSLEQSRQDGSNEYP